MGREERGRALGFKFREGSASKSLKFKGPQSLQISIDIEQIRLISQVSMNYPAASGRGYLSKEVFVLNAASDGEYNPIRIQ